MGLLLVVLWKTHKTISVVLVVGKLRGGGGVGLNPLNHQGKEKKDEENSKNYEPLRPRAGGGTRHGPQQNNFLVCLPLREGVKKSTL